MVACTYPPESDDISFSEEHYSVTERSRPLSESEDDQLSDRVEKPEQMEDGWHHGLARHTHV